MSQQLTSSESPLSQRSGSSWALAHNQKVPKWFYQTELKLKIITWTCLSSRLIFDRCLTLLQSSERRDLKNVYLPLNQEKRAMQLFSSFQSKIHSLNSSSIHKNLKLFRKKKVFTEGISTSFKDSWKGLPKSLLWWFKLFLTCLPAVKKEQLLIITHMISFYAQWKPRKQPHSKVPVKREFFWEQLMASVSMISLNLKSVIKSLCRPHFSRLNKPSSWDLQISQTF